MGQDHSSQPIDQQYNIINIRQDGSVLLQHKKSQSQFLLRNICSNIQEQITGFANLLKKRQKIKSEHLLDLIQIRKKQQKQVCSIVHKLYIIIEYPFKSLSHAIEQKKSQGFIRDQKTKKLIARQRFSEAELWSILYSCCMGMQCLYSNKLTHESLTAQQIYIDKDGLIKISDPVLLGLQKNYINILKKSEKKCYISPQIMNFVDDCNFSFFDKQKSDVFTLGVILLEACLLEDIQIYDIHKKQPYLQRLPQYIYDAKLHYSQNFCELLTSMLEIMSKSRPTFKQISQKIQRQNSETQFSSDKNNYSTTKFSTRDDKFYPVHNFPHDSLINNNYKSQINKNPSITYPYANNTHNIRNSFGTVGGINHQPNTNSYNKQTFQNNKPPSVQMPYNNFLSSNRQSFNAFSQIKLGPTFRAQQLTNNSRNQQPRIMFPHQFPINQSNNNSQSNSPQQFNNRPIPYNTNQFQMQNKQYQSSYNKNSLYLSQNSSGLSPYSPPTSNFQHLKKQEQKNNISYPKQMQNNSQINSHQSIIKNSQQNNVNNQRKQLKINSPQRSPGSQPGNGSEHFPLSNQTLQQVSQRTSIQKQYVTLLLDQGGKYSGYFSNGMKNGQGKLQFKDGGYYIGEWKDDRMHGYGRLHYENGNIAYQGQWVNDQFNGIGQVYNDYPQKILGSFNYYDFADLGNKWLYYQGELKNDSKHGKGMIKLSNQEVFQGLFVYDVIQGEGTFFKTNGQIIKGVWKDNILISK